MTPEEKEINRFDSNCFINDRQSELVASIRGRFKNLAIELLNSVPNCPDRSAAILYLRLANMQINAAICHDWPDDK